MSFVDFIFEMNSHIGERRAMTSDQTNTFGSRDPRIPLSVNRDASHVVVGQPSKSLPILPRGSIEADGSAMRAEPNHTVFTGGSCREIVVGSPSHSGIETPIAVKEPTPCGLANQSRPERRTLRLERPREPNCGCHRRG